MFTLYNGDAKRQLTLIRADYARRYARYQSNTISMFVRPQILAWTRIATYWTLLVYDNMIYLVESVWSPRNGCRTINIDKRAIE